MAAILLADCTISNTNVNAFKMVKITTPATADIGDTIDVSTLFADGCFGFDSNATDGQTILADAYGTTVTLVGSTDNLVHTLILIGN